MIPYRKLAPVIIQKHRPFYVNHLLDAKKMSQFITDLHLLA